MLDLIDRSKSLFIQVETQFGDVFEMSLFEYARWQSLVGAIEAVDKEAERLKINLDDPSVDWVQPLAFEKYIRESYLDLLTRLMRDEDTMRKAVYREQPVCTTSQEQPLSLPQEEPEIETEPELESCLQ